LGAKQVSNKNTECINICRDKSEMNTFGRKNWHTLIYRKNDPIISPEYSNPDGDLKILFLREFEKTYHFEMRHLEKD
jgi:hypothetical protein